jgi:hypothetical protein
MSGQMTIEEYLELSRLPECDRQLYEDTPDGVRQNPPRAHKSGGQSTKTPTKSRMGRRGTLRDARDAIQIQIQIQKRTAQRKVVA